MKTAADPLLLAAKKALEEEYGGYITIAVGVHSTYAYDSVDAPVENHRSGTSWRCHKLDKNYNVRINFYAPKPDEYETLPDEWLMLSYGGQFKWVRDA